MATITNIARTTDGLYWRYTVTASGTYDVWLDGVLLAEGVSAGYYDVLDDGVTPPEVEVCDYGGRPVSAWASRRMQVQWFAGLHQVFAVEEWRSGARYSVDYVEVDAPNRYVTVTVRLAAGDAVGQSWVVRAAAVATNGAYYGVGAPLTVAVRRHYLPSKPVCRWAWNGTTRKVTVR